MKFDFAIGNPPYQEETSGERLSDKPVYHYFIDGASEIADKVELIHPARFLFNAGSTPKDWNEKMLQDSHFKVLDFKSNSTDVFNGISFTGGVVISYIDKTVDFTPIGVFTSFSELNSIKEKVLEHNFESITSVIFNENKFVLEKLYADYPNLANMISSNGRERRLTTNCLDKLPIFTDEKSAKSDYAIVGLIKGRRVKKFVSNKYINSIHRCLSSWKVLVSVANGAAGVIGDVPARIMGLPVVEEPNVGYTQSFLGIGKFAKRSEAEACSKYLQTKFVRVMLGLLKVTQLIHTDVWKFVPLQNFTNKSDIDWSKSVKEVDRQLYKKYGLNNKEIEFIEVHVKEMV